jgi:NAD(P)-dependent dehydrogenase (short-subunit alcohol dehydrogenase family)
MSCTRLTGKVTLITGAASGVGRSTARRFAQEGAEVVIMVDRNSDALPAVVEEVSAVGSAQVIGVNGDVSIDADCERFVATAVEQFGRLDVLVSNAPAHTSAPFLELQRDDWDILMGVMLRASFVLGQLAARAMVDRGNGGSILYTASVSALGASKQYAHYGAAKAGIVNLTQTMAIELVDYGIRVNSVSPGPLDTPQSRDVLGSDEAMERARAHWPLVPMGRLGKPEEIAAAFAYLASDDAAYVTGQNLIVDGGLRAHSYSIPEELTTK